MSDERVMEASTILVAGPTASGKSALALSLARSLGGEIVNADSMQLYADLRVLTARPSEAETAQAPHHLYGVADAAEGWSVGRWLAAAVEAITDIRNRGRTPIVVGGTGLYFRALTQGLAEAPPAPAEVRDAVSDRYDREGEEAVRAELQRLDPAAAARIAPRDRQRLIRALSVAVATGKALSDWQAEAPPPPIGNWRGLVIEPPREALYARCDARFATMVAHGALEEARALLARGLDPGLPLMKAVGLRELGGHLAGLTSLETAVDRGAQETRRYAKRQLTWFRNQTPDWPRVTGFGEEADVASLE
jgi:tRNA dimethylallyltransferase